MHDKNHHSLKCEISLRLSVFSILGLGIVDRLPPRLKFEEQASCSIPLSLVEKCLYIVWRSLYNPADS